jgi:hypothetical protein
MEQEWVALHARHEVEMKALVVEHVRDCSKPSYPSHPMFSWLGLWFTQI